MIVAKITVNQTAHLDYGLAYPVTYKLSIPSELTSASCYHNHNGGTSWTLLAEKTASDVFSGIECVRFDFTHHLAYVSVSFDSSSDEIYLKLESPVASLQPFEFIEICARYDDRLCAVVITSDIDNLVNISYYHSLLREHGIWGTSSLTTILAPWATLQAELNAGYAEIACHSRTHTGYGSIPEYGGSKSDILGGLTLPWPYSSGSIEYVPGWTEPSSFIDVYGRQLLGTYKYLCDRSATGVPAEWQYAFSAWDAVNGTYGREYASTYPFEAASYQHMNTQYETAKAAGRYYHLWGHASGCTAAAWARVNVHLDYLTDPSRVHDNWFVGFGAAYMYHYCQERGKVVVSTHIAGLDCILQMDVGRMGSRGRGLPDGGSQWNKVLKTTPRYVPPHYGTLDSYLKSFTPSTSSEAQLRHGGVVMLGERMTLRADISLEMDKADASIVGIPMELQTTPGSYHPPKGDELSFYCQSFTPPSSVDWIMSWSWVGYMAKGEMSETGIPIRRLKIREDLIAGHPPMALRSVARLG